jgi:sec-independent protein translocase protein TatA
MTGLLSPAHIVVLLVVLLLVFGAKRLPELGRSLGSGLREFKTSIGAEPGDERATLRPPPAPDTLTQPAGAAQAGPRPAVVEAQPPQPSV